VVEVIRITLVLVLEFVEKIKELECEGRRGTKRCSREPAGAKELNMLRHRIGRAMAIPNDKTVYSVQVEDHVVTETGWVGAGVAPTMAELDDLTEGGESCRFKERAGPFLEVDGK